jgi:hypothetical protein
VQLLLPQYYWCTAVSFCGPCTVVLLYWRYTVLLRSVLYYFLLYYLTIATVVYAILFSVLRLDYCCGCLILFSALLLDYCYGCLCYTVFCSTT